MMCSDSYQGPDDHDADLFDDELDVIDCPHCGDEVYAYAEKCPYCGVWLAMRHRNVKNIGPRKLRARYGWWGWIVALLIVTFLLWMIFAGL